MLRGGPELGELLGRDCSGNGEETKDASPLVVDEDDSERGPGGIRVRLNRDIAIKGYSKM